MNEAVFLTNLEYKIRDCILNLDIYSSSVCLKCDKYCSWRTDLCDEACFVTKVAQQIYKECFAVQNVTKRYCRYCFNARVYEPTEEELTDPFSTELTDENDFSSISVGHSCNGHALYLSSGYGKSLRFEVFGYNEKISENQLVGLYSPKFCPECGRALTEYEQEEKS